MNIRKSYKNAKRKLRKKVIRTKRKSSSQKVRKNQRNRRRKVSRRNRVRNNKQRGGYQTTTQVHNSTTSAGSNENCKPFTSNSDIFQSTFEGVNHQNVNSADNYLQLNKDIYVKSV